MSAPKLPRSKASALRCWAVCAPGLEPLLTAELEALKCKPIQPGKGGVAFGATPRQLYAANLWLRTANRVVLRLPAFEAMRFKDLEAEAAKLPWADFLAIGVVPLFRVSSSSSRLYHTDAIAERLDEAVAKAIGWPKRPTGEQLFVVRVQRDQFTISVDTSGDPLHKRGYRQDVAKAPLRETLAAAVVLASGYDGSAPLVDPFCGSGTIAIEAAMIARSMAPGAGREFAVGGWPTFEAGTWASVLGEAADREQLDRAVPPIVASDRDAGAIAATRANAERAGVGDAIEAIERSVSDAGPPAGTEAEGPGWVLTNPPYGQRIGDADKDLRDLYARFGTVCRDRFPGYRVGLLSADRKLTGQAGLPFPAKPEFATDNGGIKVGLMLTDPAPTATS